MERYTKEQRVIIVKKIITEFITKLNLALLLGHSIYVVLSTNTLLQYCDTAGWLLLKKLRLFAKTLYDFRN
jgi:hypothetical protein